MVVSQSRRWALPALIILLVAVVAGLFLVAREFASPEQQAAQTSAPAQTPATARVESRRLVDKVRARGTFVAGSPVAVALAPGDGGDVVTHAPLSAGDSVASGSVLIEVAGAPVLALRAPFSPYRDVRVGDRGRDVATVKNGFKDLGYKMSQGASMTEADMGRVSQHVSKLGYTLPTEDITNPASASPASAAPTATASPPPTRTRAFLPKSWWVGIKTLPARVASTGPGVGAHVSDTKKPIELSMGAPLLRVTLPALATVNEGTTVRFTGADEKAPQTWTTAEVEPASDAEAADNVVLLTLKPAPPASLVAAAGVVELGSGTTAKVNSVPITALVTNAEGRPSVMLHTDAGPTPIAVEPGQQANGWVEIRTDDERIQPGAVVELGG